MASSCSTSLLDPSFSIKFVPYVPRASNPKPKSKAKSTTTTKTAEHSRPGVSSEDDGEWFHIDNFPMPDPNASRSLNPGVSALPRATDASSSLDHDVVGSLSAASELEKPEHYQSSRESPAGRGTGHATSVAKMNSALNGLFNRSSPEFPLIVESDAAEVHHDTTQVKPSNGASGTEGYRAGQDGDLDAASMRGLSVEGMEGIRHEPSPVEGEPLFDVDVINRSPLTRKRTRRSSGETVISSAEMLDITLEPELGDPRLAKRRRPSERQAESLILDYVPTPKRTPLPTPSGPDFRSGASNEPSPGPLDSASQGGGAGSPFPSQNNLEEENDDDGTHARGIVEELLHSPRQYIDPNSDGRRGNRKSGGSEVGKCHDDEANQAGEVSCRSSAKIPQRRKLTVPPVRERRRGPSRAAPRRRDWSTMPTRASRQVTSPQPRLLPIPRVGIAPRSCSPQTSSLGSKADGGSNINYGSSANTAYQITNLTHCHVPKGSSIVTAIVHCSESKLFLNTMALGHKFLGGKAKVIHMTQLSPGSWMLLGYQYDDGALCPCTCAEGMSTPHGDAARHGTVHPADDEDDGREDENGEEVTGKRQPHAAGSDRGSLRGDTRFRKRRHRPWLKSDEERLLAYKDRMNMQWEDIFEYFPDRSDGAIKLRYYKLRKKDPEGYRGTTDPDDFDCMSLGSDESGT